MSVIEHIRLRGSGLRIVFAGCLVAGLLVVGAGCGGAGSNGEGGEEEPSPPSAPAAPSGLSATSGDGEVSLSWETVDNAVGYRVYRATSSTSEASGDPLETDVTSSEYTDPAAENGTTYYYRVTAVGEEASESDESGEVEVTPFAEPPNRP